MNVMNTSGDEFPECPLCMEPLEVDDLNFYPCTCGYQICRFCWHRIRTDENELCPACRKAYPENPADFTPLTQEQISALKAEKRQRDQQRKQKITENRKHLANVRVVQKNLVFVVGLPPRLADPEILKKHEYFGKYGKIHKVVINPSTAYAGVQVKGPSASAYVTYLHNNDALRAIQSVNNIAIDGRSIKTSLGTTKYCSHFMKNQSCPKPDCMYLHELGDPEASFTKEEMHQGKHQEYEKRLHDSLIAQMQQQAANPTSTVITNPTVTPASTPPLLSGVQVSANGNGVGKSIKYSDVKDSNNSNGPIQGKDAWPSLSTSPSPKESKVKNGVNGSNSKENLRNEANRKHEKNKVEKGRKNHQKISNHVNQNNSKATEKQHSKPHLLSNNSEEDFNEIEDSDSLSQEDRKAVDSPTISTTDSGDSGTVSESDSGKSSPGTFPDHPNTMQQHSNLINSTAAKAPSNSASASQEQMSNFTSVLEMQQHDLDHNSLEAPPALGGVLNMNGLGDSNEMNSSLYSNADKLNGMKLTNHSNLADPSSRMSKLNLFDDNNSFFSRSLFNLNGDQNIANSQLPDLLSGTLHNNNLNGEDPAKQLLKNLGGFGSSHVTNGSGDNSNDDWETAFKYLMKNNVSKQAEDQQQEEWLRLQEMRKHSGQNMHNHFNNFNDYYHNSHPTDMSRGPPGSPFNQHSQPHQARHNIPHGDLGHVYAGNMSKFFDFHKNQQQNQQQQSQQQFMMNGHSNALNEHELNMSNMMDNRVNSNFGDHSSGILSHLHKQRMMNKFEQPTNAPSNMVLHNNQQNRLQHSQYSNQSVEDDLGFDPFTESQKKLAELISNEEVQQQQMQQQQINSSAGLQRTRMPPPGFNHIQANNNYGGGFGGVPRTQQQTGSKLLPFVNMPNNAQLQQPQPPSNWSMHMGFQQPSPADQSHLGQSQQQQNGPHKADWTSLDPAIVSFRQFPQYNMNGQQQQPPQQPQGPHQPNPDFILSQINQQNLQSAQGFGHHNMNLQNGLMNQQQQQPQTSPAQVFSHTNWLNSEQNMYMNNLSNGFPNFNDKFTIPLPPGFQNQKSECIN